MTALVRSMSGPIPNITSHEGKKHSFNYYIHQGVHYASAACLVQRADVADLALFHFERQSGQHQPQSCSMTKSLLQVNQSKGAEGMQETRQAFEYALDRIGLDVQAGALWQEYINFMQLPRPNTPAYRTLWAAGAAPGQEDSQRVMTLRSGLP